jgi:glycosyltransferase involved in cell wall biosynthesis
MTKPVLSVIIPCFNTGPYLREAVESVVASAGSDDYTIIIVDDGSTEDQTLQLLHKLGQEGHCVLHQENKGPAAARNTGVRHSQTPYLLFLDSDNKVGREYIREGVEVLEKKPEVAVFYGRPKFIGDTTNRVFPTRPFDLPSLLINNYIDHCAVVRKAAWESVGGFDENRLLIGQEDWEFWIRLGGHGWGFHFNDKISFDYRIRPGSLSTLVQKDEAAAYIFARNASIVRKCYLEIHKQFRFYQYDKRHPLRSFVKFVFFNIRRWVSG